MAFDLSNEVDKNMPKSIDIDFMSIDAEERTDEIIRSNNWEKYLPLFVIVEVDSTITAFNQNSAIYFLSSKGYKPIIESILSNVLKSLNEYFCILFLRERKSNENMLAGIPLT